MINYSQSTEQDAILRFFDAGGPPSTGRFLDIGAYNGVSLSNTLALLAGGWSGVYVEPDAGNLVALTQNLRQWSPRIRIIQAAVSDRVGLAPFYVDEAPDREWSRTINAELLASGSVIAPSALAISVPTIRIGALEPFGPYDFVSLDAEWEDMKILRDWLEHPWAKMPRMICVECRNDDERGEMLAMLGGAGYQRWHDTRENLMVVKTL